eukprot:jgi/Antlo1/2161/2429
MRLPHNIKTITTPTLNQVTIPNKYVQSYFLKTDVSYYTRDRYKFKNYCYTTDKIVFCCISHDRALFDDGRTAHLDRLFENMFINKDKFENAAAAMDVLGDVLSPMLNAKKETFLGLSFVDWLSRTELMSLIRVCLGSLQIKGLFLVPYSLSIAASKGCSSAIVVHVYDMFQSAAVIDDGCLIEKQRFCVEGFDFRTNDEEDFVEDLSKKPGEQDMFFTCKVCKLENTRENILAHLKNNHLCESEDLLGSAEINENLCVANSAKRCRDSVSSYVKSHVCGFKSDKNKKNFSIILCNQTKKNTDAFECIRKTITDGEALDETCCILELEDCDKKALDGTALLGTLDMCKDLWLSDCEWQDFGLRILKEKVLFHV